MAKPLQPEILGKVLEILDKRGELETVGWMFMGQASKEAEGTLRQRMDAPTAGYWWQENYLALLHDDKNYAEPGSRSRRPLVGRRQLDT